MILKNLSDQALLIQTKSDAQDERNLTLKMIENLREIESRRLHLKSGFSSLYEYMIKELKYSEGSAYRRIKAMRLVKSVPESIQAIESGSLSLSTACQLQTVFETKAKEQKALSQENKLELLTQVQNKSKREAERTLAKVCPEVARVQEKVKPINEVQSRLELVIDEKLLSKIRKLQALTSHKNKNIVELLESLVDQELKRIDPDLEVSKPLKSPHSVKESELSISKKFLEGPNPSPAGTNLMRGEERKSLQTRYVPAIIKQHVWRRDKGSCQYVDPTTKRKCESTYQLQYDHIQPFAKGGETSVHNMRLLCSAHNQLMAVKNFGAQKMDKYLKQSGLRFQVVE